MGDWFNNYVLNYQNLPKFVIENTGEKVNDPDNYAKYLSFDVTNLVKYCNQWEQVHKKVINSSNYVEVASDFNRAFKVNNVEEVKEAIRKIRGIVESS